ncbi:hypothetical protein Pcinc_018625 [Petrolisthes cinctipes]|uniref:G-protein coupled receptors family 2 profile 2 domain-containing protein n=1 Tax=Petrolisthes cinctipes TaxID=88211 RepID=A0AAE1FLT8_PETCI|nr:hypothetical protein Pcinc_018625 [Petrolisthes cinctipes]
MLLGVSGGVTHLPARQPTRPLSRHYSYGSYWGRTERGSRAKVIRRYQTLPSSVKQPIASGGTVCCGFVSCSELPVVYFVDVQDENVATRTRSEVMEASCFGLVVCLVGGDVCRAPPQLVGMGGNINLDYKDTFSRTTSDFCMEQRVSGEYYAGICRPNLKEICQETTCVTKCCGLKEEYSPSDRMCRVVENNNSTFSLNYETIYGNPTEPSSPHVRHDIENYCLEYNADEGAMIALVCVEKKSRALLVKETLQTVGVAISAVFLLVTVILHLAISDLRDVQGLCLLSHMVSLLIADVALFTSFQFSNHMSKVHCVINGLILQYFFLVAFFWLSAMCFDIWRVIR